MDGNEKEQGCHYSDTEALNSAQDAGDNSDLQKTLHEAEDSKEQTLEYE
jgi:hypothetical protein